MSAITGIFYRDGRNVEEKQIKKMNDRLSHRGPDGSAIWCEGPVALGHQMLHTTPESLHEKLPFEEDGLVITADARIDNREELSVKLEIEDKEEVSDSYFILKAYQKWGEKCPEELLGDFAFAIWDKEKEKLFCARDHMGVKPFYYYLDDEVFVFGTEIKALFSNPETPYKLNDLYIALTFAGIKDRYITSYLNILRLPAAYLIKITFKNDFLNQYWQLNPEFRIYLNSDKEYEKAFRDIFIEAISCRLRSNFPVGSMLSGGLDSSSVSCVSKRILNDKERNVLKTYSAFFDNVPESNERYYIEKVVSDNELNARSMNGDKISPLENINEFLWYSDQPLIAPNTFMSYNIYKKAFKDGVRVILDGYEGDTTLSHGEGYFKELARTMKWKKLIYEVKCRSRHRNLSFHDNILLLINIFAPNFIKSKIYYLREIMQKPGSKSRILRKEFIKSLELMERINRFHEENIHVNNAHAQHYQNLKSPANQYKLEFLDWMSAPFQMELRHPFFDKRLIEFCLAIPTEQKYSKGWDRYIMRRAMSEIIPAEIQWREKKANLGPNFRKNLLNYEKKIMDEIILNNPNQLDEYLDIKLLQKMYIQYKTGNTKSVANVMYIWNALIIDLWIDITNLKYN